MIFIKNTIFTDYAIKKINRNVIQDYEDFYFTKVKVSNKLGVFEPSRTSIENDIYTIVIDKSIFSTGVYTLYCTIPAEVENINIKEIGVYETILEKDYLFSISKISEYKPGNLPYDLIITLDINFSTIDIYPLYPSLSVTSADYASTTDLSMTNLTLTNMTIDLERLVVNNSINIGYNTAQVFYQRQQEIDYMLNNFIACSTFSKISSYIGIDNISDYFSDTLVQDNLFYKIKNLKNSSQTISITNNLLTSEQDNIYFSNPDGSSLFIQANLGNLEESSILNKISSNVDDILFNFEILKGYLTFTIYGTEGGYYTLKYDIQSQEITIKDNEYNNFYIIFNNNFSSPEIKLYINGTLSTTENYYYDFTELPSYGIISLKNYTYDISNNVLYNPNLKIKNIINFNKILTNNEIFVLNSLLSI